MGVPAWVSAVFPGESRRWRTPIIQIEKRARGDRAGGADEEPLFGKIGLPEGVLRENRFTETSQK